MLRAHCRRNLHSPLCGKGLGAGHCTCSSFLLKLMPLKGYGICQEDSLGFSTVDKEEDVLQSRACLLHHPRERVIQFFCPGDGCRE